MPINRKHTSYHSYRLMSYRQGTSDGLHINYFVSITNMSKTISHLFYNHATSCTHFDHTIHPDRIKLRLLNERRIGLYMSQVHSTKRWHGPHKPYRIKLNPVSLSDWHRARHCCQNSRRHTTHIEAAFSRAGPKSLESTRHALGTISGLCSCSVIYTPPSMLCAYSNGINAWHVLL